MGFRPRRPARHSKTQHLVAALVPALIVVLSITGFVWAQKQVTVVVDGVPRHVRTHAEDVAELLDDEGLTTQASDVVNPAPDAEVKAGMTVVVRHAVPVIVKIGSESTAVDVVGETVADALVAAGLDPEGMPGVSPPLATPLSGQMVISVPDVLVRIESEQASMAPSVRRTEDSSLGVGEKRVVSQGRPGRLLRVYRVVVAGGIEAKPVLTAEQVIEKPTATVIAIGTAPKPAVSFPGALQPAARSGSQRLRVEATGYSSEQPGLSEHTATGMLARHGVVAVDPAVIPLGTRLYVQGYGMAVAADTGSAIRGARIDLCFDTVAEARAWGRRTVTVYLLQ
ncbi:MAG TPA: 3D domain-containing protein [Coriobacteriia bacterium]|nr:3D domain-containing protein [Coriobacteriia bacterium]